MAHLTPEERKHCMNVFLEMDTDGNGTLDKREFMDGLRKLGYKISDEQAGNAFKAIDEDGDGTITFDEFLKCVKHVESRNPRAEKEAKLRRIFNSMDRDKDGLLNEKELLSGLQDAGYNVSKDQCRNLVKQLDKDNNGKISFEEFICMFKL